MELDLSRTVIIDPAFLGDVVFDAPLVRAVKAKAPGARVGIVVRPPADGVARAILGIDRVHVFDKRGADGGLRGIDRIAGELEKERYTTALIPHPSVRSVLVASRAMIPARIGSSQGILARRLLTARRAPKPGEGFVEARLRLLGEEGADRSLAGTLAAPAGAKSGRARVGLALGSEWATKRWSIDQAAGLLAGLEPERFEVVFLGSEAERPLYGEVVARLGTVRLKIVDGVGESVGAMVERIAALDVLVAGDTGPLHIARGLGVATIALFGPTSEKMHDFASTDRVLTVALECRPCSTHGTATCPEGHHRCMKELSSGRVREAVDRALAPGRR